MTTKTSIFDKPLFATKIKSANVKAPEILIGYLIGPFGGLLLSGILGAQITTYWKYVLFANELVDSSTQVYQSVMRFMTLLPLLSAILVVIGNLLVGQLIERTKTKAGKARPWLLLSSVFLGVACILMFIAPSDAAPTTKMILQAVSYNIYYAIAYPLYNTSNSTLIPTSTRNSKQRGALASATNMASLGVMGVGSMIFPVVIDWIIKYESSAWTLCFVAVGILSFLIVVLQYYFTRERVTEETLLLPDSKENKPSLKMQLKLAGTDKYWWIVMAFYLIFQFAGALKNASMYDFCNILFGDTVGGAGTMQAILGVVGAIPMALAIIVIWPLANKFGKKNIVFAGLVLGVAGGIIAGLFADNIIAVAIGIALKCLGSAPACYMILAMISDMLDHIEAKSGLRCDGFTMSIYSAIMIVAVPVTIGIFSGLMGSAGFVSLEGAVQPPAVKSVVVTSYIWVETIAYAVCGFMMLFFVVEKHLDEDHLTIRKKQQAEALAAGIEWIEPEERLRREEEAAEKQAEEARKEELRVYCQKKGLDYQAEEAKYQAKLEAKKAAAARKAQKKK